MRIHVLGPAGTDSEHAAEYWLQRLGAISKIEYWQSYTKLFQMLECFSGDYIVMPAGYIDSAENTNWLDLHFTAYEQLILEEAFVLPTMTMAILELDTYLVNSIALQPATKSLLSRSDNFFKFCTYVYVSSKPIALKKMLEDKLHYCLTTLPCWSPKEWNDFGVKVKDVFNPTMVWCVYCVR